MAIRDKGLRILDKYRAKLDYKYDLRRCDVTMRVYTYDGEQIGEGNRTYVDTLVGIKDQYKPKVKQVSQDDIMSSGGVYQALDIKVGPLTPTYSTGGNDPVDFAPEYDSTSNKQVLYQVAGPGMEDGAWFVKVGQELLGNFGYYLILRKAQSSPE